MSYLQAAFDHVITDAETPQDWYVCLIEEWQAYGGPEEGGWWQTIRSLEAYKKFPARYLADEAREQVRKLAEELEMESHKSYGEHCLRQTEWLDARGLDADYFPEDDGPSTYRVIVTNELPVYDNIKQSYC